MDSQCRFEMPPKKDFLDRLRFFHCYLVRFQHSRQIKSNTNCCLCKLFFFSVVILQQQKEEKEKERGFGKEILLKQDFLYFVDSFLENVDIFIALIYFFRRK